MHQTDSAIFYLTKALTLARDLKSKKNIAVCYQNLAKAYANKKDFIKAYEYERAYSNLRDTLTKENYQKYVSEMETKYDTDKKKKEIELLTKDAKLNQLMLRERELESNTKAKEIELLAKQNELVTIQNEKNRYEIEHKKFELENQQKQISLLDKEKKIQGLEIKNHQAYIKQQRTITYIIIGGFVLAICFSFFIFNGLRKQRKANLIISKQKEEVDQQKAIIEEHQKETIDSINYAKRIQYALLANEEILKKNLPKHFVLFNPKDIVSGDFYWATSVRSSQLGIQSNSYQVNDGLRTPNTELFYLAVCDSTGHGVPGAFMSLLNIGFLSEAIKEKGITKPNEILNYVRTRLIDSIGAEGRQDGMDAILLCIETTNGKTKYSYAAANNEPVIIRNNDVIILPKDKMPVGKGERNESFNLYTIDVQDGDTLYLYTDGYADQFGGPKAKKFKYRQLNDLLISVSRHDPLEQLHILKQSFQDWKGSLEQVDDVCIVGVKI
jgi:serine phosphatase RsbU (regulator of sigma subunit)